MHHKKPIRYAVVGLGHIAQNAVLPAFAHAENSKLVALVSDDPEKRRELGEQYGIEQAVDYDDYEDLLARGDVDAVYIALPNNMHHEFVIRSANAGVHVLCEKPLAVTSVECEQMIAACEQAGVMLMTAYRLHFEKANLKAIEIAKSGQLGEVRLFTSTFTMPVRPGNIRIKRELGGGTLYDIGIYCINAARYLFQAEPNAVQALNVSGDDQRFDEVDEATSAILHFPGERMAAFTSSFGTASTGSYQLLGTKGDLRVDPAYEYQGPLTHFLTIAGKTTRKRFPARDQFAAELIYFSKCILQDYQPEPSGLEGLADVRVIEALYRSAASGERIWLPPFTWHARPNLSQEIERPPVREPELVNVAAPSLD
jgi:predicted dehydrogenase